MSISERPDPDRLPFTAEQPSERFASAGADQAAADRRLASYLTSVQAAELGRHPLSGTRAPRGEGAAAADG
jgi:hypothetical protein